MKKHTFDPLSFVAGAIFLMISAAAVLNTNLDYELSGWVLPASVLVLGVGLLAASLRGMRGTGDDGTRTTEAGAELSDDTVE
jgi:hypothetical protein